MTTSGPLDSSQETSDTEQDPQSVEAANVQIPVVQAVVPGEAQAAAQDESEESALGPYLAAGLALLLLGVVTYLVWGRRRVSSGG